MVLFNSRPPLTPPILPLVRGGMRRGYGISEAAHIENSHDYFHKKDLFSIFKFFKTIE
jgi:hypothetical protein